MLHYIFTYVPSDLPALWRYLHPDPRHGFFLGSGAATPNDHLAFFSAAEPVRLVRSLHDLRQKKSAIDAPRFVGSLSFEAGRLFDNGIRRLRKRLDPLKTPPFQFGDYRSVVKVDLQKKRTTVFAETPRQLELIRRKLETFYWMESGQESFPSPSPSRRRNRSRSKIKHPSKEAFSGLVRRAKEAIAAGDIYQANISMRFQGKFNGDPLDLYRHLCQINPSPYAGMIKSPQGWLVSCSPELLLEVKGDQVVTRPIAGTRPRGKTGRVDSRRRGQLLLSPKERAEHIMLVDLERNDLGRVCVPGTVKVTERYTVERYSHVMHIVSEVKGRLKKGKTAQDALSAVFPGGTITGCPKIKSIEIIEALEGVVRGPFYGSAGFFNWNGDAKFNILIRTALIQGGNIYVQAGAGIVADSHPQREYREVMAKAQVLLEAAAQC